MVSIDLRQLHPSKVQEYLESSVVPRPIGLVSTISETGQVNLSPFCAFNMFSANPPIIVFSPTRKIYDNQIKDTLRNIQEVSEAVVHIVDYAMIRQAHLSSCEYAREINEFDKAGFTMEPALEVRPPMIKECKIKMECHVREVKPLGAQGGAGNLVICEVAYLHLDQSLLDSEDKITISRLNLVARMGRGQYALINRQHLFQLEDPQGNPGMGIDQLPGIIRNSKLFTGNHLALLASVEAIPKPLGCFGVGDADIVSRNQNRVNAIQLQAMNLLDKGNLEMAWQVLLQIVGGTPIPKNEPQT